VLWLAVPPFFLHTDHTSVYSPPLWDCHFGQTSQVSRVRIPVPLVTSPQRMDFQHCMTAAPKQLSCWSSLVAPRSWTLCSCPVWAFCFRQLFTRGTGRSGNSASPLSLPGVGTAIQSAVFWTPHVTLCSDSPTCIALQASYSLHTPVLTSFLALLS